MARGEQRILAAQTKYFVTAAAMMYFWILGRMVARARGCDRTRQRKATRHYARRMASGADRWSTTRCEWSHLGPACLGETMLESDSCLVCAAFCDR